MKTSIKAWIEAMRLRTLPVSVSGVIVGCGCAAYYHSFRVLPAAICLIFALLAQIVSNFANEYFDFRKGLDKKGREGFRRGVTEGDISPTAMKNATFGLLLCNCLIGLCLIFYGGIWLIGVGLLIAIFALIYSAGPYPLSHHGLGEIAVIIFFGFIPVVFTEYVQSGLLSWNGNIAVPLSFSIGLMAANVLIVNNYRDMEDDSDVGKRTLVVMFGRRFMACVYLLFGLGAMAMVIISLMHRLPAVWVSACGIYLVFHFWLFRSMWKNRGKALNPVLGQTAMLLFFFSIILSIALCCYPQ